MEFKVPIPDHTRIENLKKEYGCIVCHEILVNAVITECCGTKICRYCFMTSLKKHPKCPSCLEKCKSALDYPKVDKKIEAVFVKVGPKLQEEREMFLKNRKLHEIMFELDEEFDNISEQEQVLLAAMTANALAAQTEPVEPKSKKNRLFDKNDLFKKTKQKFRHRRFRRGNVQPNPFKKPLQVNSTGSLRGDFLVRKALMTQFGLKHPAKMDMSPSAYAIRNLYGKPKSVLSAPALTIPDDKKELSKAELKIRRKKSLATIKKNRIVEAKKRLLAFESDNGDKSEGEPVEQPPADEPDYDLLKMLALYEPLEYSSEDEAAVLGTSELPPEEPPLDQPFWADLEALTETEPKEVGEAMDIQDEIMKYLKAVESYLEDVPEEPQDSALQEEIDERESVSSFRTHILELQSFLEMKLKSGFGDPEESVADGNTQTDTDMDKMMTSLGLNDTPKEKNLETQLEAKCSKSNIAREGAKGSKLEKYSSTLDTILEEDEVSDPGAESELKKKSSTLGTILEEEEVSDPGAESE